MEIDGGEGGSSFGEWKRQDSLLPRRKIRCFWMTLGEWDERQNRLSKKSAFLRFLRGLPEGAGFELEDYRDVWAVYKACRASKRQGAEIKVCVRKTSRGVFKVWKRSAVSG